MNPHADGLAGAFSGALTTTFDVMTITHKMDINAAQNKAKELNTQVIFFNCFYSSINLIIQLEQQNPSNGSTSAK